MPSAPRGEKAKLKNTKPPETFAELFEPFFKKNRDPRGGSSDTQDSKTGDGPSRPQRQRPDRNPPGRNPSNKKKPK
jgi:hypothetical protein